MEKVTFRVCLYIGLILLINVARPTTQEDGLMVITQDADVTIANDDSDTDDGDQRNSDPFEATNEWQNIKPGQAIPAGLHVEMNLATGLKRAKLLRSGDVKPRASSEDRAQDKFDAQMFKDLKEQLRGLPNDDISEHHHKESDQTAPGHFKSMDELKSEFEKMNITFSTDNELILKLLNAYRRADISNAEKANKLIDLEYYVHQYDNANDFVKMGGLSVATAALNSTVEELRINAAFLIGSAMQSNPPVQISSLEGGILHHLLHILTVDESLAAKTKALYALSCMLRQFPYAQKKFLDSGGLNVLSAHFRSQQPDSLNLKLKTITLLHDLVLESLADLTSPENAERRRQYQNVNIRTALVAHGFCEHIPSQLLVPDHVAREKVLNTMLLLVDTCDKQFRQFATQLALLQNEYAATQAGEWDGDIDYLKELNLLVNTVITKLPLQRNEL